MARDNEYGNAIFLLSEEEMKTEQVLEDIKTVAKIFSENPEYAKLLDTPAISKGDRCALIDEAFSSLDEYVRNLIKMLCEKRCVYSFSEVEKTFVKLYDTSRGIERVEAITAVPMTDAQTLSLKEKLEAMTNKTVIIKNTVSPDILGGVKLRYGNVQLDTSLKTRLEKFEESLKMKIV